MGKRLVFVGLVAWLGVLGVLPVAAEKAADKEAAAEKGSPSARPTDVKATCTASCGGGTSVTCTWSGTCEAVDRNCAIGQRGYVKCGTTKKSCAGLCPVIQDCSRNQICNMACGVSDPDCIQTNPCTNTPTCTYAWSPQTYCCLTNNAGCQDYCL